MESSASVFLGNRRLKIIDLSDIARQPLANEDETIWVTHNGEIYNFLELRRELEKCGHVFRSHSDTETIVHAYEEFGESFLERLEGRFAFALWYRQEHTVHFTWDRLGEKSFYYMAAWTVYPR